MSIQHLTQLRELARDTCPELSEWLETRLRRWRGGEPLDHALDLAGTGAVIYRNRSILRAAKIIDPRNELTPWALAGRLEQAISRYEATAWPRVKDRGPGICSPLSRELFNAFSAGCQMVRTQRNLYDIIR